MSKERERSEKQLRSLARLAHGVSLNEPPDYGLMVSLGIHIQNLASELLGDVPEEGLLPWMKEGHGQEAISGSDAG